MKLIKTDKFLEKINKAELALLNRRDKKIRKNINTYFKYKQKLAELITEDD